MIPEFDPERCRRAGRWQIESGPEPYAIFYPAPLPPQPPIQYDAELQELIERANRALGRLDGVTTLLPDPTLFLYTYIRKEAVLSSQIEGTQSSLSDLLLFENEATPGVPLDDVKEVSHYVAALQHGLDRFQNGFPLSLRLIKEIHAVLLKDTRGSDKERGEFRRYPNWIGGSRPGNARYVPPPVQEVLPAMGALEKFLYGDPLPVPTLIKAGLAHAQFESIHPFLDGNGRLGRLLITFILCVEKALSQPLLYLSLYFKERRDQYFEALQKTRTHGDWEGWLKFYLTGVEEVAHQASETARNLVHIFERDVQRIQRLGRAAGTALRVYDLLKKRVLLSPVVARRELGLTFPAVNKALFNLAKLGLVREVTGKQTYRVFAYSDYLEVLREGT